MIAKNALLVSLFLLTSLNPGLIPVPALAQSNNDSPNRNLLIVVDGLRPDYITSDLMPNLYSLGERGVFGDTHSAAFPTVTRVNSPSISTGSYPARHGLIHNTMWAPEVGEESFSTGEAENLQRFDEATNGGLLTAVSVGELMDQAGYLFLASGSGGSGNTFLQNHKGVGKGIWSATGDGFFVPESAREEALEALGEIPNTWPEETVWAFNAYLYHALGDTPPDFTIMWINETDATGHAHGIGSPELVRALNHLDIQIGRMLDAHEEHGLSDKINIFVTADHGFTTNTGRFSAARILREAGLNDDRVRVVSNMVYLNEQDEALLFEIVETLQRHEDTGVIYTRPAREGSSEGTVPGTLSTAVIQWDHARSADILVSLAWVDQTNEFGYAGATTRSGTATHGSESPYDVRIRLVAAGPDIKEGVRSEVPTGNVDFIPTLLHLLGIEGPSEMDGRILKELLRGGPDPETIRIHEHTHGAATSFSDGFRYQAKLKTLQIGSTFYLRGGWTEKEFD